jgi:hypothetical protein
LTHCGVGNALPLSPRTAKAGASGSRFRHPNRDSAHQVAAQMEQSASSRPMDVTAIFSRGWIIVTVQVDHHVEGWLPPPRRAEELQMPSLSQASGHCEFARRDRGILGNRVERKNRGNAPNARGLDGQGEPRDPLRANIRSMPATAPVIGRCERCRQCAAMSEQQQETDKRHETTGDPAGHGIEHGRLHHFSSV